MEQSGSKKPSTFHPTKADSWERTESVIHRFHLSHNKQLFTVRGRECDTVRGRGIESNNIKFENRWRNSWPTFTLVNTVVQILCGPCPLKLHYFIAATKCAITCTFSLCVSVWGSTEATEKWTIKLFPPTRLVQALHFCCQNNTQWNIQKQRCC